MYNEQLAFAILLRLNEEFPRKVQLNDLRQALDDFSNVPEEEWLAATHALIKLGHAQGRVLTHGLSDAVGLIYNIEITDEGRDFIGQARRASEGESGDIDDLLPIFAKRQFDKDIVPLLGAAKSWAPLSLVFVDLDHFKSVNDAFDHLVGNEVLIKTAKALKAACDKKGRCYRWGGEEFAALLPNYTLTEASALAERVREAIYQTDFKGYPHRITASIGVSTYPETSSGADDLVRNADKAMLEAKNSGRNRVRLARKSAEMAS